MNKKQQRLPIDLNLNDNAKHSVVALASAVIVIAIVRLIHIIGGKND